MNAREHAEKARILARACAGCGHSRACHLTVNASGYWVIVRCTECGCRYFDMVIGTEGESNE